MAGTAAHGTAKTKFRIFFFSYHVYGGGPSIPGSAQAPHASGCLSTDMHHGTPFSSC